MLKNGKINNAEQKLIFNLINSVILYNNSVKKIFNFLFNSYHRPSAKIEHLLMLFVSLLLNKSAKTFSERMMLLKVPPQNLLYYNFFGRLLIIILNFLTFFFNKNFFFKRYVVRN